MIATQIKTLRNRLDLSQTAFGERLNVSRNVINNLELGRVDANDMMISHICNTFGVNEKWLREGAGEMFAPTVEDELSVIAQRHNLDEMDVAIIRTYITLPKQAQDALKDFLIRLDIQRVAGNRMPDEWAAEIEAQEKNRSEQAGAEEQSP